ncbi:hypothetical protein [Deinococcus multiflagellatus]|uniref:Uncharacterized protein n=1 Tax=Deinococcus multiflagellatus TaxID=1656887 RepID=A0ABW1ZTD3_9DEIO|nr:hypothetical protein [Deinococcus multiflagellatus]MBZ9714506.1 hypothetical protein [Deinococcus multiflagellatus]
MLQHLRKDAQDGLSHLTLHPAARARLAQQLGGLPGSRVIGRTIKDPDCSAALDFRVWELLCALQASEPGWGVVITARGCVLWPFAVAVPDIGHPRV